MAAFDEVAKAMEFDRDIWLGAHNTYFMKTAPLKGELIYNMEPLYDGCRALSLGYMETLKQCDVIDYSRENVKYLAAHGVEAFYMPYGYHPSQLVAPDLPKPTSKDIDVLFIGSGTPRREMLVSILSKRFKVEVAQGVYGVDRDRLLLRAKLHLNIHANAGTPLEVVRLNYLLANGCTVVTEPGNDPELNAVYSEMTYMATDLYSAVCSALWDPLENVAQKMMRHRHDCSAANAWANARRK